MKSDIFLPLIYLVSSCFAAICSGPVEVTAEQLKSISAAVASSEADCKAGMKPGDGPTECVLAAEAATEITNSFRVYSINSVGVAAGLISNQLAESNSFHQIHNHNNGQCNNCAGNPGHGTYAMLPFPSLLQFTLDTPSLKDKALAINAGWSVCAGKVSASPLCSETSPPDQMEANLALANVAPYRFSTSPWYATRGHPFINGACGDILKDLDGGQVDSYMSCLGSEASIKDFFPKALEVLKCADGSAGNANNLTVPSQSIISDISGFSSGFSSASFSGTIPLPSVSSLTTASGEPSDSSFSSTGLAKAHVASASASKSSSSAPPSIVNSNGFRAHLGSLAFSIVVLSAYQIS